MHIWIAMLAILLNALVPSISHALAGAGGQAGTWEICRADGKRYSLYDAPSGPAFAAFAAANDAPGAPAKESQFTAGEHCAYCLPHAGDFALPATVGAAAGVFGQHPHHPFLFYRSPRPLTAWSAARPRGPPALA